MMETKWMIVGVLVLAAAVASGSIQKRDTGAAQEYQQEYQQEPEYNNYNNYYNQRPNRPARRRSSGPLSWIKNIFSFNRGALNRDSGGGHSGGSSGYSSGSSGGSYGHEASYGGGSGISIADVGLGIGALVLCCVVLAVGSGLFMTLITTLNGSGRGIETDEWEIDHSVWMDQLQKDFEDSWATE